MTTRIWAMVAITIWIVCTVGADCVCGRETLNDEREKYPFLLEAIAGKFHRLSEEALRWQIEDRTNKLKERPNHLPWMDELAIAHDKLGETEQAISIARQQLLLDENRYETLVNLGTFLAHQSKYEDGLLYLRKAIDVRSQQDIHRVLVHVHLLEYLLSKRIDGKSTRPIRDLKSSGFNSYGWQKHERFDLALGDAKPLEVLPELIGMLRYSDQDAAIVLEAIGDLVRGELGARAYLRAGMFEKSAAANYRKMAEYRYVEETEDPQRFELIEARLGEECREAELWAHRLYQQQATWIRTKKNVDEEFAYASREPATFDYDVYVGVPDHTLPPMNEFWRFLYIPMVLVPMVGFACWTYSKVRERQFRDSDGVK